ncbi:MAG: T9SS type A sorting domain-containing protein [Candidatus Kerfeldbacteria bacterium]|nr:T9SS type A sorting domain-containing protein [Candidatus Kerfeldbacteria bacterium]
MRTAITLIAFGVFFWENAGAVNQTPSLALSVACQPYEFDVGDDGDKFREAMNGNHYLVTPLRGTSQPQVNSPEVTIDDFKTFVLDSASGVLFWSSHGGAEGGAIEIREHSYAGYQNTVTALRTYRDSSTWEDVDLYLGESTAGYHVGITPEGIEHYTTGPVGIIHTVICGSQAWVGSWCDSRVIISIAPGIPGENAGVQALTIWSRMGCEEGPLNRTVARAVLNTIYSLDGNGATVLAPIVLSVFPGEGMFLSGPMAGQANFDTEMDQSNPGTAVDGSNGFLVQNAQWETSARLVFDVVPVRSGTDYYSISGSGARSAGGRIAIDGDGNGSNEDSRYTFITSTVGPPNTAAAFDLAKAWQEADGLHVAWITGAEHGSNRFEVYAGPNKARLLVTVPAAGSPSKPHYYEVVTSSDGSDVFQVYEEDDDPTVDYATPYLSLESRPDNLDALRSTNATVEAWPDPADPDRYAGLPEHGEASLRDVSPHYVFISTRSDFINAVQPVIDWYENHGKIVATVVAGSPNPDLIRDFLDDYYGQALQQGRPIPFVYLVGEANEGSVPAYNVVGMEYFADADCYWGACSSDLDLVDFNGDGKPEMNWSRVLAHDVPTLQKSVASGLEALNGQNFSAPRVLCVLGDGNATCQPQIEPTATFQTIIQQYQAHGVPVIRILDSELPCSDWLARRTAAVNAINSGITEFIGSGRVTNRLNHAFVIQKQFQYPWSMNLVPRRQHIVAEAPGCGLGDADRNFADQNQYPGLAYTFLNHDPALGTTAVAWHSLSRGAPEPHHLLMARTYFAQRWSGTVHTTHEAHFRSIREAWELYPELRSYLRRAVNYGWETRLSGMIIAVGDPAPAPAPPQVLLASPNPFSQFTSIRYTVPLTGRVTMAVYDVAGRCIRRLLNDVETGGLHTVHWDGRNADGQQVATGTYFVRQTVGGATYTAKLVLAH